MRRMIRSVGKQGCLILTGSFGVKVVLALGSASPSGTLLSNEIRIQRLKGKGWVC